MPFNRLPPRAAPSQVQAIGKGATRRARVESAAGFLGPGSDPAPVAGSHVARKRQRQIAKTKQQFARGLLWKYHIRVLRAQNDET
jgi:hypothetical protein